MKSDCHTFLISLVNVQHQFQWHFQILKNLVYQFQIYYIWHIKQRSWINKILISLVSADRFCTHTIFLNISF